MRPQARSLLAVISMLLIRHVTAQVPQCPCFGELGDDANIVQYAGSCFLVQRTAKVTWHNATAPDQVASSSCVQEYTLAALIDPHLRLALAHRIAQEANMTAGMRLRVALAKDDVGSTNTWLWTTDAQRSVSANVTDPHLALWQGEGHMLESELHTSAVLHVHSGQLVTASVDEPLPALLMTTPPAIATITRFSCLSDTVGSGAHTDIDIATLDIAGPAHQSMHQCATVCHQNAHCRALSVVPADGGTFQCVLHSAYSSASVHVHANAGGQFCTKSRSDNRKMCGPLVLNEDAQARYSSASYNGGTVATVSCASGTYFYHNKETQVQVACDGDTGHWSHWDAATYMCIRLTKLWLVHPYYTPKWQEWQPGAVAVNVSQGSDIDSLSMGQGSDGVAVYYRGSVYFIMLAVGHVYKVDPATRSVSRQADIAIEYVRASVAGALLPGGRVLVCGGHTKDTCYVHWPATGATQWSTSIVGGPRASHAMCYYRHRVYIIGGYLNVTSMASVISTDAAALDGWRPEPAMAAHRHYPSATVFRGLIYVCAGFWTGAGGQLDTCESFDGAAWTPVAGTMPRRLYGGTLGAFDGRTMYYASGNPLTTKVSAFDAATQTWSDEPFGLIAGVHRQCAIEMW